MGDHPEEKISPRLEKLERVYRDNPRTGLFLALAEEYRKLRRYEDALRICLAGLERFPGYASARVTLAQVLVDLGRDDDAERELAPVLELSPENILANRLMVRIVQNREELSPQTPCLVRLLELSPDDPEANRLTNELAGSGSPGREEDVSSTAAGEQTDDRPSGEQATTGKDGEFVTATMAELYLEQGLPGKALEVIGRLLEADPSNEELAARKAEISASLEDAILSPPVSAAAVSGEAQTVSTPAPLDVRKRKLQVLNSWLHAAGRLRSPERSPES